MAPWTHRLTGRRTLIAFGVWLGFQGLFAAVSVALGGKPPPDLLLFADAEALRACLEALGPEGRAAYKYGFAVDTFYPLVYGTLLAGCIALGARALGREALGARVALLPFFAAGFDWSENVGVMALLAQWPEPSPGLLAAVALFNSAKWGLAFASMALGLAGVAVALVRRRQAAA